MWKSIAAMIVAVSTLASMPAFARPVTIEVTNLTNGIYFTPLLVAAHSKHIRLYEIGAPASANLQAMAEGGDISGLITDVEDASGAYAENPAGGALGPGMTASATLDLRGRRNRRLSVVAMLLPTNDGFVGLDSARIPKKSGTYIFYLKGYDAGTEANDELITGGGMPGVAGIPGAPGGDGGSGGTGVSGADANTYVHIHRGNLGDAEPVGGISDVDSRIHRWMNPVARVVVIVH